MRRREFIGVLGAVAAVWSPVARAQQSSSKVWRLAFLYPGSWEDAADQALFDAFREELQRLGYIDGKNLIIDRRGAEGHNERLLSLMNELIVLGPDVIVAVAAPSVAAALRATSSIPIVMWGVTDPVGLGFVKSLAYPGGNTTGGANMYSDSIGKSVELLHSIVPTAKRMLR
jgi:putative ABC transport system substrate-binding protein